VLIGERDDGVLTLLSRSDLGAAEPAAAAVSAATAVSNATAASVGADAVFGMTLARAPTPPRNWQARSCVRSRRVAACAGGERGRASHVISAAR